MRTRLLLAAAAVVLVGAAPAAAHVSISPTSVDKGGFAKLTFRTPNERPDADTVKVEVFIPTEHPIANVSVKPVPGWSVTVERTKLGTPVKTDDGDEITEAVSHVTWSGGAIKPGEFQEFDLSVGPLPEDVGQLVFKAIQTYSSGEVVRWIEEPAPGTSAPEHAAPVLKLTAAAAGDGRDAATATTTATTKPAKAAKGARANDDVGRESPSAVAWAALVLAMVALVMAFTNAVRKAPK